MQKLNAIAICGSLIACTEVSARPEPGIPERGATPGYECNAEDLNSIIGQEATFTLGDQVLKQSGAKKLRWIPPKTAVTMDYRSDRLNIAYDEKMIIIRVNCG